MAALLYKSIMDFFIFYFLWYQQKLNYWKNTFFQPEIIKKIALDNPFQCRIFASNINVRKIKPNGCINNIFGRNYSSLDSINNDSYIIHLVGDAKPWIYFNTVFVNEWDKYFKKSPFKLHKLKRKSIKPREFMVLYNVTKLSYHFFRYWRYNGFKYAMGKMKYYFYNKKKL